MSYACALVGSERVRAGVDIVQALPYTRELYDVDDMVNDKLNEPRRRAYPLERPSPRLFDVIAAGNEVSSNTLRHSQAGVHEPGT